MNTIATHFRQIKSSSFLKSLAVVLTGTAAAQLIALAFAPLIARLYSPELFGVFGIFMSITGILGSIATLKYDQAILLAETDAEARSLRTLSLAISFLVALFSSVGVAIAIYFYPSYFFSLHPALWIFGVGVGVFSLGANSAFQGFITRQKKFRTLSNVFIVRSLVTVGIQAAAYALQSVGLIMGSILGQVCSVFPMVQARRNEVVELKPESRTMSQLAREYFDFPAYNAPQALLNALSQNAPVLILAWFAGPAPAGAYAMTVRLLQRPMGMLTTPLRQVFFQRASEMQRQHPAGLLKFFRKTTLMLFGVSAIPVALTVLLGPWLFETVLGGQWKQSGQQSQWLILWLGVMFANVPAIVMSRILRLQRAMLGWDVLLLSGRCIALIAGCYYWNSLTGVALFSIIGFLFNAAIIVWIDRVAVRNDSQSAGDVSGPRSFEEAHV